MNYFTHMPIFLNELVTPHAFSAYCTVYTYAFLLKKMFNNLLFLHKNFVSSFCLTYVIFRL